MKTGSDLQKLLKKVKLESELDLERAFILDRKLRLLVKEHPEFAEDRKRLRMMIKAYEKTHWGIDSNITDKQIKESDNAEFIAEQERKFIENRKHHIQKNLLRFNMSQQDLGLLLGHNKSYMSELMNGISPFSMKDLILLNRLFRIELKILIPTIISQEEKYRLEESIKKLKNPSTKLKLGKKDLVFA